jgi:hypothetical protein
MFSFIKAYLKEQAIAELAGLQHYKLNAKERNV